LNSVPAANAMTVTPSCLGKSNKESNWGSSVPEANVPPCLGECVFILFGGGIIGIFQEVCAQNSCQGRRKFRLSLT
jgi:hypothetical protein